MTIDLKTNLALAHRIITSSAALETIIFAWTIWNIRSPVRNDNNNDVTYGLCNQFQFWYIHSSMPNRCYIPKYIPALHFHSVQCRYRLNLELWRIKWIHWRRNLIHNLRTVEISIGSEILGQRVVSRPRKHRSEQRDEKWYHNLSRTIDSDKGKLWWWNETSNRWIFHMSNMQ